MRLTLLPAAGLSPSTRSGNELRCYLLSNDRDRFTAPERRAFARRECDAGYDGACQQLVAFLEPSDTRAVTAARR